MISVKKLDGKTIILNADLIMIVEATPDTMITLTTGIKILVLNTVDEVVTATKEYKKDITHNLKVKEAA